ncbi:hypothetical protein K402DRAFT_462942 [Aulographum hederae CBS 113979]|uniref:Myb-like domain-containing protein n=1 Tax=Aulographum hederae CBS 113979 TaxID=1176131 RepID=A0A6G1H1Y2_9PEZI|nr:hypothetical protein K402DRAFT_462942 [Aulographum hederae CBS 113979]
MARSSSRRTTPQPQPALAPAPAPIKVTRLTRSQSRDLSDQASQQPAAKQGRGSRQTSVESTGSTASGARVARGAKRAAQPGPDLTTVEEDTEPQDVPSTTRTQIAEEGEDEDEDVDEVEGELTRQSQSPSAGSTFSGTTAITSFSQVQSSALKPDQVLSKFSGLHDCSLSILSNIAPGNAKLSEITAIIEEVEQTGSTRRRILDTRKNSLKNMFIHFTASREFDFIEPKIAVKALFPNSVPPQTDACPWRPDDVFFRANLAKLAYDVLTLGQGSRTAFEFVRDLDQIFPLPGFLSSFATKGRSDDVRTPGSSELLEETLRFGLEIRTQLAILCLQLPEIQLSQNALHECFFDGESDDARSFEGADVANVGLEAWQRFEKESRERETDIDKYVDFERGRVNLEPLCKEYSWLAFQQQALSWIRLRNREISAHLEELGGPDEIATQLENAVRDIHVQPESTMRGEKDRTTAQGEENPLLFASPKHLKVLSKNAKRLSGGGAAPSANRPVENEGNTDLPQEVGDGWRPLVQDDEEDDHDREVQDLASQYGPSVPTVRGIMSKSQKEYKENLRRDARPEERRSTLLDRQPNAERVQFGDGFEDSQEPQGTAAPGRPVATQAGKRPRPTQVDAEDEPSEDEGFQEDTRATNTQARRSEAPIAQRQTSRLSSPAKRRRTTTQTQQRVGQSTLGEDDSTEDNNAQGDDVPDAPLQGSWADIQAQAKANSTRLLPVRKERKAWTVEETDALFKLITDYGCAWATILAADEEKVFRDRSQVDLKDKARIIKFIHIKAHGSPEGLPDGFDGVTLKEQQRNMLRKLGFVWEKQREPVPA